MSKQLDVFEVHENENNQESQTFLNKNRHKFNAKCKQVYDRLMAGEELTVLHAANTGIASLPRRRLDIVQRGFRISDRWENGVKIYFVNNEDRIFNLEHQKSFLSL